MFLNFLCPAPAIKFTGVSASHSYTKNPAHPFHQDFQTFSPARGH
jgi:hypothetical protein